MSAKHTPGPWTLVDGGRHWNNPIIDNYRIHTVPTDKGFDITTGNYGELLVEHIYEEADARLIAAAPELLEALKGVIRVADRATVEFDAARAAIAKAEGQS